MLYKVCFRDYKGNWTQWSTLFCTISEAVAMGEELVRNSGGNLQYKVGRAF